MSYFEQFKKDFFFKIINSSIRYEDNQIENMINCFNIAAKETLAVKKKEDKGYQAQRSPKASPVASKGILDLGKQHTSQETKTIWDNGAWMRTCWICGDGHDLRPGGHCNACGRDK